MEKSWENMEREREAQLNSAWPSVSEAVLDPLGNSITEYYQLTHGDSMWSQIIAQEGSATTDSP